MRQLRSFPFTYHLAYPDSSKYFLVSEEQFKELCLKVENLVDKWGGFRYLCIGYETGEDDETPHLQGFVMLKKKKSFNVVANPEGEFNNWHIEEARGNPQQNREYCFKESIYTYENGEMPGNGGSKSSETHAEVIRLAQEGRLEEIAEQYPAIYLSRLKSIHQVRVEAMSPLSVHKRCIWLYGKPGTGKSRLAFSYENFYPKNPNKWWDNYSNQTVVILDDLSTEHHILGYYLKRWSDRYPILCEIKGSSLYPSYDVFIVTSNYRIRDIFHDEMLVEALERRFIEYEVFDHKVEDDQVILRTDKGPLSKNLI